MEKSVKRGRSDSAPLSLPFRKTGILTKASVHDIEMMLAVYFDVRANLVVPNVSWGFLDFHEADLMIVTKAGYLTEVEIKRSWTDFKADFRKRFYHKDDRLKEFYYAVPECMVEPCFEFINEEREQLPCPFGPLLPGIISYGNFDDPLYKRVKVVHISSRLLGRAQKLTSEEVSQLSRLGTLRYWSLLVKLRHAESEIEVLKAGHFDEMERLKFLLQECRLDY